MIKQFSREDIARHLIVWSCVVLYFIIFSSISGSLISKIIWNLILLVNFSFSYYILLLYVWPNLFDKRRLYFLFLFILLLFLFFATYLFLIDYIIPSLGAKTALYGKPLRIQAPKFLINFSYVVFASIGTYYNRLGIKKVKEAEILNQNNIKIELMILKSQFHSHLTFNFLNFCYNKIRHFSSETAVTIEEFSFMLRYSLKEESKKIVCLQKEIEYIENFISFQKSLINPLYVEFKYEGELSSVYIPPKILIVFIENAFKHGVLHNPKTPITIFIKSLPTNLFFSIQNHKSYQKGLIESGIGLKNIKQILTLFYPNNHLIKIKETDKLFICELNLTHQLL